MDFLQLAGKSILVFGVANKKSVAWHTAQVLTEAGARVVYVVRSEARKQSLAKLLPADAPVCLCDVERQSEIDQLAGQLRERGEKYAGLVHSIAFADYAGGVVPFHDTPREAFLRAVDISCFSLVALAGALKD